MDNRSIDVLKGLTIDIVQNAHGGHLGIGLGAATTMYTLFTKHLKVNPFMPEWINRDRFVLSAGHASALLYATLFLSGYQITIDDLKKYRRIDSKFPGHPERGNFGIDITTGSLGQGFASAVGIALSEKIYEEKYNKKPTKKFDKKPAPLIDFYTYVLASDGDLMEGVSYEAASFAGCNNINKLIVLYDSNKTTMDENTNLTFTEDVLSRFSSMGWSVFHVKNGESVKEIDKAIINAKKSNRPSIIKIDTKIGRGSKYEGTNKIHNGELEKDDYEQLRAKLRLDGLPFTLLKEPAENIRNQVVNRGIKAYDDYEKVFNEYKTSMTDAQINEYNNILYNRVNFDLNTLNINIDYNNKELLRDSNSKIMNIVPTVVPNFIGGSADVSVSTKTYLNGLGNLSKNNYLGKNIFFGVRENAMGAILNGMAATGFRPFGSTFLAFSDNLKPSIRMSAIMNLPVTYIFTHDSVTVGADGPTHEPVEQLASFRATPNLYVYRPCDIKEIIGTWNNILNLGRPAVISLARTEVKPQKNTKSTSVKQGAYIIEDVENPNVILIATGAEVQVAVSIKERLLSENIGVRVISMPCMELFDGQSETYKQELFKSNNAKIFVLEYGSSFGWEKFVISSDYLLTVDKFGKSGSKDEVLNYLNIDIEQLIERIKSLL